MDGNSLLHNSQILYGSGNSDGNRHTHVDSGGLAGQHRETL